MPVSTLPANDASTYRDLLLFEERLKTNAASLQKRKSRYQLFLLHLVLVLVLLLAEVLFLQPAGSSIIAFPYAILVSRMFPGSYNPDHPMILHPYIASGLLFVSATTLVLFFATGVYRDKIAYANRYVPQANRALRSFNMYLNVRKPPLRSRFSLGWLPFLRPSSPTTTAASRPSSPLRSRSRSRSPSAAVSHPINPIPPASNPRGELIFSSRVDKAFREGYEKHRAAFERRREEKERRERAANSWISRMMFWRKNNHARATSPGIGHARSNTVTNAGSLRGRTALSRSSTPEHLPTQREESRSPGRGPGKEGILRRKQLDSLSENRKV